MRYSKVNKLNCIVINTYQFCFSCLQSNIMAVTYKNLTSKIKLDSLIESELILFPEAYALFDCNLNQDKYQPYDKSIFFLKELIEDENVLHQNVLIEEFVITKHLLPYMFKNRHSTENERELARYLQRTLSHLKWLHQRCFKYLRNDLYSKEKQLEKRREKRKRHRHNKRKHVDDWSV